MLSLIFLFYLSDQSSFVTFEGECILTPFGVRYLYWSILACVFFWLVELFLYIVILRYLSTQKVSSFIFYIIGDRMPFMSKTLNIVFRGVVVICWLLSGFIHIIHFAMCAFLKNPS